MLVQGCQQWRGEDDVAKKAGLGNEQARGRDLFHMAWLMADGLELIAYGSCAVLTLWQELFLPLAIERPQGAGYKLSY